MSQPAFTNPPPLADELLPRRSFWEKKWVRQVLPWITSISLHAGIIIIGIATYQAAVKIVSIVREQITIADTSGTGTDLGGIPNPGLGTDPDRSAAQDLDSSVNEKTGLSEQRSTLTNLAASVGGSQADDNTSETLIGSGPAAHGKGSGGGLGNNLGGGESSGSLAPFGVPGGGQGIGPKSRLFGHGGNARRIVYICDASGSMMSKIETLKAELELSVNNLLPDQEFDVIFFHESISDNTKFVAFADSMQMATVENKKKLYGFLDQISPSGATFVIPALTFAFHLSPRPDLMYLLTDGAFEDEGGDAVRATIKQLDSDKRTRVSTTLFYGADLSDPSEADELREAAAPMIGIANDTGGNFVKAQIDQF